MALSDVTPEIWTQDEEKWEELLNKNYDSIPLLNVNDLKHCKQGTLVKFHGMVQDTFNPEYYNEKHEVINTATNERKLKCGKYVDDLQFDEGETIYGESLNIVPSERQTVVVISVPGLNSWVKNIYKEKFSATNQNRTTTSTTTNKHPLDTDDYINTAEENPDNSQHKRSRHHSSSDASTSFVSQGNLENYNLPDFVNLCHAHIYKNFDDIKLNDVVEIVGFLSMDSNETECDQCEFDESNSMKRLPSASSPVLSRIHCVAWKKIEHNNCLVGSDSDMESREFMLLKNKLLAIFGHLLLGDTLAAEYLLYHLISKVYSTYNGMALGKFALNLSYIPSEQVPEIGQHLYAFIEELMPKSYYLPLSIENLNDLTFIPRRNYDKSDRLRSGILQLSCNTHLVIDELRLKSGELRQSGTKALYALSSIIKSQRMDYDFKYYTLAFECDIPCLIVSEGKKSILPNNFHVVLKPDVSLNTYDSLVAAAKQLLNADLVNKLRIYLTLARFAQYQIDDNINDLIAIDFAKMRQEQPTNVEDMHNLLVLARLICLSQGKRTLDWDSWKTACALEDVRKRRITN